MKIGDKVTGLPPVFQGEVDALFALARRLGIAVVVITHPTTGPHVGLLEVQGATPGGMAEVMIAGAYNEEGLIFREEAELPKVGDDG